MSDLVSCGICRSIASGRCSECQKPICDSVCLAACIQDHRAADNPKQRRRPRQWGRAVYRKVWAST